MKNKTANVAVTLNKNKNITYLTCCMLTCCKCEDADEENNDVSILYCQLILVILKVLLKH